ncbi:MAG: hypothetical protein P1U39_06515 [Legionellaceae bacterium]|nr:hypothetical protein [Legionellaceae bacterium]
MKPEQKQDLLIQELKKVVIQFQEVNDAWGETLDQHNIQDSSRISTHKHLNEVLTRLTYCLKNNTHEGLSDNIRDLDYKFMSSIDSKRDFDTDKDFNYQSPQTFIGGLVDALRKMFNVIDFCDFGKKGETPLALKLTGRSQFFPPQIKSPAEARNILENISKRLNECQEELEKQNNPTPE